MRYLGSASSRGKNRDDSDDDDDDDDGDDVDDELPPSSWLRRVLIKDQDTAGRTMPMAVGTMLG